MRKAILENIKDGLLKAVGRDSSLQSDVVEDIQSRIPENTAVNKFIGVDISTINADNREIGVSIPTSFLYSCDVVLSVKSFSHEKRKETFDTIYLRMLKYFRDDTGGLKGLSADYEGVNANVIDYKLADVNFAAGSLTKGTFIETAVMRLTIMVQIQ